MKLHAPLVWIGALLVPAAAVLAASTAPHRAPAVSFNREVRPILSDRCFQCHGPDEKTRMGGLRLDLREEAMRRGVLSPGKPQTSRLLARVSLPAGDARLMPPASAHPRLTPVQRETLRRWIAAGAPYEVQWALRPLPERVTIPSVPGLSSGNPIDHFVRDRLRREGITPSPEAPRLTWLRRVTLDLHGVPPTLEEQDAFTADRKPGAYERVADRLLSHTRYGERMASAWLDLARYADSYGYQSDQLSPTWPYRDWVIRAYNSNLPYDQFLTWQLAGDLLPNATRDQRLATAFNRIHRMTNEGGSVPEEWRLEGVADRVHTFGTAFLGLTLECARCHDHKYDPISQRDYYSLSAFFNNIDEHGLYDRADIVPSPSLLLPSPEQEKQLNEAREAVAAAERTLEERQRGREAAFQMWRNSPARAGRTIPDEIGRFDFEAQGSGPLQNRIQGSPHTGAFGDQVPLVRGKYGQAAQLDGENNVHFPTLGRFHRNQPYTIAFQMRDPGGATRPEPAVLFQACSGTDTGPHGYDLMLENGALTARLFRHWPGNAIAVRTPAVITRDRWTHVAVTYDGSSRASGLRIYLDGRPVAVEVLRDRMVKGIGLHTLVFGQRFRDKGFKGGEIDEIRVFARALTPLEAAEVAGVAVAGMDPPDAALRETYFSAVDAETRAAQQALAAARQRIWQAEDAQYEIAVMEEMPGSRPTYLLERGAYDAPRSPDRRVERVVPAAVFPWPADAPRNRLGLARWLTHPRHPLTARVAVNRIWSLFFGRGLVESAENFGSQGRLPSHPELLDYLAVRFARGDGRSQPPAAPWDTRALVRLIVLSATYRQNSALRPDLQRRDPANVLLARGPSHRLPAEAIRDTALAAGGLLDGRMGGPPVSPYQPGDLWREANSMSPAYRQSVGADLYRRSLYSVWKRTAPLPNALVFDAVSREVCVARRQTTGTPLQALVLLNDTQFVEAARVLGEATLREGGATPADHVRFVFRRLAGRLPNAEEGAVLVRFYEDQRRHYRDHPQDAASLLKVGERKPDAALPPVEVAAAAMLAQAVLNLDATLWKR